MATAKPAVVTLLLGAFATLVASSMIVSSGWRGRFIIPLFFVGAALGAAGHELFGVDRVVVMAAAMVAVNVGVTKTRSDPARWSPRWPGSACSRLLASMVALFGSSRTSMIESQRAREAMAGTSDGEGPTPLASDHDSGPPERDQPGTTASSSKARIDAAAAAGSSSGPK